MKKESFLTIIVAAMVIALTGCSKGYRIEGTIEGANDGDTVAIMTFDGKGLDTLHLAIVKDGKFEAAGSVDSITNAIADYKGQASTQFFLENADIKLEADANEGTMAARGTLINDRNTELYDKMLALNKEMSELFEKANDNMTEAEQETLQKKAQEYSGKMENTMKQFIRDNVSNYAGQFYLANYASDFGDEFINEMLAVVPEKDKNSYALKQLQKDMEAKGVTAIGKEFTDFSASTPDGETLALSDVAKEAKVLMIDFWASWCGPCRSEMPNVKEVYERFHDQGFEILGVSLDDDASEWKKAIEELGMAWPQVSDLGGWQSKPAGIYAIQAIPATVFIKDGKIVARDVRGEDLAPKVEELLK